LRNANVRYRNCRQEHNEANHSFHQFLLSITNTDQHHHTVCSTCPLEKKHCVRLGQLHFHNFTLMRCGDKTGLHRVRLNFEGPFCQELVGTMIQQFERMDALVKQCGIPAYLREA